MFPLGFVLYVKLKAGHHHFLLTKLTEMHSSKLLTMIPSILDHKIITSSSCKSWRKKNNSISIPYRTSTKFSSTNFSKKNNNKGRHFKLRFESLQKHKQDSLSNKPKTQNHLSLTKAQMCNYFVYQKSLVHVVTLLIPLQLLTSKIWSV